MVYQYVQVLSKQELNHLEGSNFTMHGTTMDKKQNKRNTPL